jgi:hypothetical protein
VTDGTSRLTDGARVKLTPATDPLAAPAHNG